MDLSGTEQIQIILKFIEQINVHNVDGLCDLVSIDHHFIDALGSTVEGREQIRKAWTEYFRMIPDYHIACDEILERNNIVAAFGTAGGTYCPHGAAVDENKWVVPAAWRAKVVDNLIAEWRVYADNEPLRLLMSKVMLAAKDTPSRHRLSSEDNNEEATTGL